MSIARWSRHHARGVLFVFLVLACAGGYMLTQVPVLLFPMVSFPRIRVSLDAGNRPAERMMVEITRPAEEALRGIAGVEHIRSVTSRGTADIDADFPWGRDMVTAELQANAALARILPTLPSGTRFDVRRMNPTVYPVMAYSLTSDSVPLEQLRHLALFELRPALSTVPGVAKIGVQGGQIPEWRVVVDEGKLRSFGLTLGDVAKSLSAANVLQAVGHLQQDDRLYLTLADTRLHSPTELAQAIIRSGPDGVVHLDDIATVRRQPKPRYVRVTANGKQSVLLSVYQQPGGNTVGIATHIKAKLKQLSKRLPQLQSGAIKVSNWYDQSGIILESEGSVRDAILVGVGLAAVVLFVFLRDWKITLIATLAVPATLATTVLLLRLMGMSFNIMTLGGMAAAVGLIIDDAIVMVEHVRRRLDAPPHGSGVVVHAVSEFTTPLMGSSLSTVIIFIPLAFLSGVTGAFFKALSLTMAASLVISFLMAWLAVPVVSSLVLSSRRKENSKDEKDSLRTRLQHTYKSAMGRILAHAWCVWLLLVPLFVLGWIAFGHVQSGFMPSMDEGGFVLDYHTPPGTSLEETDRELRQVEQILSATPAVQTFSRRTGLQLGGGVTEANQGDFFIRLKPFPRPPINKVMSDVRKAIAHKVPAVSVETSQLMADLIGDLTGVPEPIDIKLSGPDEKALLKTAPKVAKAIRGVNGVVEVKNGIVVAGDSLDIQVDRIKAALEGITPHQVARALSDYLSGKVTTQIEENQQMVSVRVWVPPDMRKTREDIDELPLHAQDGHVFPLERVANVSVVTGTPQIDRYDLQRVVSVTGRIEGRDLGSTMSDIKKLLNKQGLLPKSVTYQLGGIYQQQQQSFHGLLLVMVAALILVFTLLLFLYRSILVAAAFLTVILAEIACIFLVLWATSTELDIMSIMGMTMIVGIVTEVCIFYFSEFAAMSHARSNTSRLVGAGLQRARAIAMTTIAAILALGMLALGIGQGAAMLQPLAIAIVAGLFAQLPLSLVLFPALIRSYRNGAAWAISASRRAFR